MSLPVVKRTIFVKASISHERCYAARFNSLHVGQAFQPDAWLESLTYMCCQCRRVGQITASDQKKMKAHTGMERGSKTETCA